MLFHRKLFDVQIAFGAIFNSFFFKKIKLPYLETESSISLLFNNSGFTGLGLVRYLNEIMYVKWFINSKASTAC